MAMKLIVHGYIRLKDRKTLESSQGGLAADAEPPSKIVDGRV